MKQLLQSIKLIVRSLQTALKDFQSIRGSFLCSNSALFPRLPRRHVFRVGFLAIQHFFCIFFFCLLSLTKFCIHFPSPPVSLSSLICLFASSWRAFVGFAETAPRVIFLFVHFPTPHQRPQVDDAQSHHADVVPHGAG